MNTSKRSSFFPIGSVSSALMCSSATAATGDKPGPPARGAFSSEGGKDKQKEVAQCKSQQPDYLSHVVEEFFWIGSSIVAFSKWRLGYMGKVTLVGYQRYQTFVDGLKKPPDINHIGALVKEFITAYKPKFLTVTI